MFAEEVLQQPAVRTNGRSSTTTGWIFAASSPLEMSGATARVSAAFASARVLNRPRYESWSPAVSGFETLYTRQSFDFTACPKYRSSSRNTQLFSPSCQTSPVVAFRKVRTNIIVVVCLKPSRDAITANSHLVVLITFLQRISFRRRNPEDLPILRRSHASFRRPPTMGNGLR